jgi:hypothetical protein
LWILAGWFQCGDRSEARWANYPRGVAEAALAHVVGDKVEDRRGDLSEKRRRLMDAWAAHCQNLSRVGSH